MPVEVTPQHLCLQGYCSVEEAEDIFSNLQKHAHQALHLEDLTHPHAAVLQALMACQSCTSSLPADEFSAELLRQALLPSNFEKV